MKTDRDEGKASRGAATADKNISLTVNGKRYQLVVGKDVNPDHTLAYTLRETLGYTGTKIACDHGSCGACTVLMDGEAVLSCTMLTVECDGKKITTIEGLENRETGELHPLQQAFINGRGDKARAGRTLLSVCKSLSGYQSNPGSSWKRQVI